MILPGIMQALAAPITPIPSAEDPFDLLQRWFDDAVASKRYAEPGAMALATATPDGRPSVRIVLCKAIERERHAVTFFTNYTSRKGRELEDNPFAAAAFYWPHAERQARIEGPVERLSGAENDAYFATRPLLSRIGAAVSPQSQVIRSRADLLAGAAKVAVSASAGDAIRRPDHWGGYRLLALDVELWAASPGRLHQRLRWRRSDPAATTWTRDLLAP